MKRYWVVQCTPENYYNECLLNNGEWEWARNNKHSSRARNGAVRFDEMKKGDKALCFVSKRQIFTDILEVVNKVPNKEYKELVNLKLNREIYITLEDIVKTIPKKHDKGYFPFTENHTTRQGTFYALTEEQFKFIYNLNDRGKNFKIDDFTVARNPKLINRTFTTRHETGEKAEKLFKKHFAKISHFTSATLKEDMRLKGVGYDFEFFDKNNNKRYFVEVKGTQNGDINSVLFTPKEWEVANEKGDKYFLVIVNLVQNTMQVVQNPSQAMINKQKIQIIAYNLNIKPLCHKKNLYTI